jgi:hypothetical protein
MARRIVCLLKDPHLRRRMSLSAAMSATRSFSLDQDLSWFQEIKARHESEAKCRS